MSFTAFLSLHYLSPCHYRSPTFSALPMFSVFLLVPPTSSILKLSGSIAGPLHLPLFISTLPFFTLSTSISREVWEISDLTYLPSSPFSTHRLVPFLTSPLSLKLTFSHPSSSSYHSIYHFTFSLVFPRRSYIIPSTSILSLF
jgi:hypothetical protein